MTSESEFNESPPAMDVNDPRWPEAFQAWWWRKCEHYNLDPIDAFVSMLGDPIVFREKNSPYKNI